MFNQELFKKQLCNQSSYYENMDGAVYPVTSIIIWKWSIHYASLPAMSNPVWINHLCNLTSHHEECGQLRILLHKGSHHVLPPNQHYLLSTKMNGTQRRTLVSPWMMHCMYCSMPKGTSWAEAMSSSEKIKSVPLAIVDRVALVWRRQCFCQSVENSVE